MATMKDMLKGIEAFVLSYVDESLAFERGRSRKKLEEVKRGLKHSRKQLTTDFDKIYLEFYKRGIPYTRGVLPQYSRPRRLITRKRVIELEEV